MKYLNRMANTELIKKIASENPALRQEAMNYANNLLLETSYETGIARKYFKKADGNDNGIRIVQPGDTIYDPLDDDSPAVKYSIQPSLNKPMHSFPEKAVVATPFGTPIHRTFQTSKFTESFQAVTGEKYEKSVNQLYTQDYDVVEYFENGSLKTLMDTEDSLFFNVINGVLAMNSNKLAESNIMPIAKIDVHAFMFSKLKDFHNNKQVPASKLLVHFELFNVFERTVNTDIEGLAAKAVEGDLNIPKPFSLDPLILNTSKYAYYSFDKKNETAEKEAEQYFIDLNSVSTDTAAGLTAADKTYIGGTMQDLGYRYLGTDASTDGDDMTKYSPALPVAELAGSTAGNSLVGCVMMRSYILPKQRYFGAFDLWLEDAKTIVEKKNKFIKFHSEEELIIVAKNPWAVTVMDVWERKTDK